MFFRRAKPLQLTFAERLEALRKAGFSVEPQEGDRFKIGRNGCAALVEDAPGGPPRIGRAGLLMGSEIGYLIDRGYQKFWKTASGRCAPALASQLSELHSFEEDLREGLGLESWFNESLGTTFDLHQYDRLQDRDSGVPQRPWEHGKPAAER
jgi:hypothetical protein